MSDEELRSLERIYQQSGSPQDFLALNAARIRTGMLPLRDVPYFLLHWAADIHRLIDSGDDFDPTDVNYGNPGSPGGPNWFEGTLLLDKLNVPVDVTVHTEVDIDASGTPPRGEQDLQRSLEIEFERLHSVLCGTHQMLRAIIYDATVTILIPRKAPPDWNLRRPYEESQVIPNIFLNAEDLLNYLMVIYRQEIKSRWKEILESPGYLVATPPEQNAVNFGGPNYVATYYCGITYLRGVLQVANILKTISQLLNKPNTLMEACIDSSWFKNLMEDFSHAAESFLHVKRDLRFDLEQIWPVRVRFDQDQYILSIETSYNDIVDPEEFDVSDPESQRGYVDQVASNFSDGLELFMDGEWNVEWEYEDEYEPGSEDITISLKAETPITASFLENLLIRGWKH